MKAPEAPEIPKFLNTLTAPKMDDLDIDIGSVEESNMPMIK